MTAEEAFNEYRQAYENAQGLPSLFGWASMSPFAQAAWLYIANRIDGFKGNGPTAAPDKDGWDPVGYDAAMDELLNRTTEKQRQMAYELLYASGCRVHRS